MVGRQTKKHNTLSSQQYNDSNILLRKLRYAWFARRAFYLPPQITKNSNTKNPRQPRGRSVNFSTLYILYSDTVHRFPTAAAAAAAACTVATRLTSHDAQNVPLQKIATGLRCQGRRNTGAESGGGPLAARRPREAVLLSRGLEGLAAWATVLLLVLLLLLLLPERSRQGEGDPFNWD